MTKNELNALRHVAAGMVLFHNGLWGGPAGYRWAGGDGASAGQVPQWESEILNLLECRGLITISPTLGARDMPVVVTPAARRQLSSPDLPVAA
ncbi:hypothetical protein [Actinophytocola sp.]|uniref:hypothetical protein n=1 Tax=Actinophytocola sp. TaxID=1872138 RepID=UPI002D7E3CD6|nr:hypothetical protein [Actinophytocola sp.]HET9138842.1 hypothetical protein [Actinophytocola sp.]